MVGSALGRAWHWRNGAGIPAVALALASIIAGCGAAGSSKGGGGGSTANIQNNQAAAGSGSVGTVNWGVNNNGLPFALDITASPTGVTVGLVSNIAEGLTTIDSAGNVQLGLASTVHQASPTVYVYTLKPGLKFSDGHPITVADVVFSMNYEKNPTTSATTAGFYKDVKSITADGSDKVKVTLLAPDPSWKYVPGHYAGWVYEKAAVQKAGKQFGTPQGVPIGYGPYKITQYTGNQITYVRNPYWQGPKPAVAKFIVHDITNNSSLLAGAQSGSLDAVSYVPPADAPEWQQISSADLISTPSPALFSVLFNVTKPPFNDVHVRRAMLYGFDRTGIIKSVYHGLGQVVQGQTPPNMFLAVLPAAQAQSKVSQQGREYPFSLSTARAELAKSSYAHGFKFTLRYSSPTDSSALEVWAAELQKIGIDMTLKLEQSTALAAAMSSGAFSMYAASGGSFNFPDPLNMIRLFDASNQIPPNGINFSRYKNPALDDAFNAESNASTQPEQVKQTMKALSIVSNDVPNMMAAFTTDDVVSLNKKLVFTDFGPWSLFLTPWMADIKAAK